MVNQNFSSRIDKRISATQMKLSVVEPLSDRPVKVAATTELQIRSWIRNRYG
jgi:hypothetical protein